MSDIFKFEMTMKWPEKNIKWNSQGHGRNWWALACCRDCLFEEMGWMERKSLFFIVVQAKNGKAAFWKLIYSLFYWKTKQNTEQNMSHLDLYMVPTRTQITSRIKIIFLAFIADQIVFLQIRWKLNASAVTTALLCFLGWLSGVTSPGVAWTSLP